MIRLQTVSLPAIRKLPLVDLHNNLSKLWLLFSVSKIVASSSADARWPSHADLFCHLPIDNKQTSGKVWRQDGSKRVERIEESSDSKLSDSAWGISRSSRRTRQSADCLFY